MLTRPLPCHEVTGQRHWLRTIGGPPKADVMCGAIRAQRSCGCPAAIGWLWLSDSLIRSFTFIKAPWPSSRSQNTSMDSIVPAEKACRCALLIVCGPLATSAIDPLHERRGLPTGRVAGRSRCVTHHDFFVRGLLWERRGVGGRLLPMSGEERSRRSAGSRSSQSQEAGPTR
jgi:hypothetical protein